MNNTIDLLIPYTIELLNLYFEELTDCKLELKDIDIKYLTKTIEIHYHKYCEYLQEVNKYNNSIDYVKNNDKINNANINLHYIVHMIDTRSDMFFELSVVLKNFIEKYMNGFERISNLNKNNNSNLSQLNMKYWKLLLEKYNQIIKQK